MGRFRKLYGASPLHLLAVIATLALVGYGFFMIFKSPAPESTLIFFVAAIFAHDMLAFPLYSGLNRIAGQAVGRGASEHDERRVPAINYLRVPFILSAFCFLLFFPLILGLSSDRYSASTGMDVDMFVGRWLGITAAVFLCSAVAYAVRLRRTARAPDHET